MYASIEIVLLLFIIAKYVETLSSLTPFLHTNLPICLKSNDFRIICRGLWVPFNNGWFMCSFIHFIVSLGFFFGLLVIECSVSLLIRSNCIHCNRRSDKLMIRRYLLLLNQLVLQLKNKKKTPWPDTFINFVWII